MLTGLFYERLKSQEVVMTSNDTKKYFQLIRHLRIPEDRKEPTESNLRWQFMNAWISNRDNWRVSELISLLRPYV